MCRSENVHPKWILAVQWERSWNGMENITFTCFFLLFGMENPFTFSLAENVGFSVGSETAVFHWLKTSHLFSLALFSTGSKHPFFSSLAQNIRFVSTGSEHPAFFPLAQHIRVCSSIGSEHPFFVFHSVFFPLAQDIRLFFRWLRTSVFVFCWLRTSVFPLEKTTVSVLSQHKNGFCQSAEKLIQQKSRCSELTAKAVVLS